MYKDMNCALNISDKLEQYQIVFGYFYHGKPNTQCMMENKSIGHFYHAT